MRSLASNYTMQRLRIEKAPIGGSTATVFDVRKQWLCSRARMDARMDAVIPFLSSLPRLMSPPRSSDCSIHFQGTEAEIAALVALLSKNTEVELGRFEVSLSRPGSSPTLTSSAVPFHFTAGGVHRCRGLVGSTSSISEYLSAGGRHQASSNRANHRTILTMQLFRDRFSALSVITAREAWRSASYSSFVYRQLSDTVAGSGRTRYSTSRAHYRAAVLDSCSILFHASNAPV